MSVIRKCERLISVYFDLGGKEFLRRLRHRAYQAFGLNDPDYVAWETKKRETDLAFDRENEVQTGGIQELFNLTIVGQNAMHGLSHIASDPREFELAIRKIGRDLSRFSFIDFGSGKGRALMLALNFPFKRVIGVEFAVELHAAAKENFKKLAEVDGADSRVELVCADAAEYPIPEGPLVVYLFNPFGSAVVGQLATNLKSSWDTDQREIFVCYMNPIHADQFTSREWKSVEDGHFFQLLNPGTS